METVRLRLVFEKPLSKAEKLEGMKRCWILLKPQYKTISDFSSHLLNLFDLHNACPNGLLLSMDGFALPPFESTSILKNEDIIRVEKKKDGFSEIVKVDEGVNALKVVEIVDDPPASNAINLLANKEFDNESGGYETESEDDTTEHAEDDALSLKNSPEVKPVSKKRKASKELQSSNSKKEKSDSVRAKKRKVDTEDIGNNGHAIQDETLSGTKIDRRSKDKSVKMSNQKRSSCCMEKDRECGPSRNPEYGMKGVGLFTAYRDCLNRSANARRSHEPQGNGDAHEGSPGTASGEKKLPSRSARRKKAKRQWLRELRKAENKEKQLLEKFNQQSENVKQSKSEGPSEKRNHKTSEEAPPEKDENKPKENHDQPDPDSDVDDDIVPIVIRPGHIRFKPLSKADSDQTTPQNQIPVETFQWNGITSKKKGQKWGMEKPATYKKNDSRSLRQDYFRISAAGEETSVNDHIDFDKLAPYTTLPKEGDVIAYRLIELSSSWTPELSPYRVGKISRYDMETNMILLLPAPGFPIPIEKTDGETCNVASGTSIYGEDGSLQTKFSVLIDVRVVKHGNQNSEKSDISGDKEVTVKNQDARANYWSENKNEAPASTQANGAVSVWDEINQALDAKKAQLTQQDNWKGAESSGTKPWSYRALRGSALGPTMAMLRSQNGL